MSVPDSLLPFFGPGTDGDQFEAFCHDLVARTPGYTNVRRWGVSGDAQGGFDVLADHADGEWGFQCKREKEFGRKKVERATAQATRAVAQAVILLARPATVGARTAAETAGWEMWDASDLSQRVRALPTESGVQLVRAHFGNAVVERFLGIDFDLPWTPLSDFFEPFLRPGRLFSHDHALAGRHAELHALVNGANQDPWVAILSGRGGIGKSRLVLEAGRRLEASGTTVRVVDPDQTIRSTHVQALPAADSVLLVVDDAHRRADVAALTRLAVGARTDGRDVRLWLTTRPYGLDALRSSVASGGADVSDVAIVPPLGDLSPDDLRALAREALGPDLAHDAHLVQRLVDAAGDSPLVLSLGATLVGRGQLDPGQLRSHDDFRRTILDRFQDEALGAVVATVPRPDALAALRVTAAAGPLNTESAATVQAAASVANLATVAFQHALGALETAGVLLRRGRQVRISPDVLSDHVFAEASVLPGGRSTGYAEAVFEAMSDHAGPVVLRNLAELDWRQRQGKAPTDLVSNTWATVERTFRHGDATERVRVLQLVRPSAYYLPHRVLALCRLALDLPLAPSEQSGFGLGQDHVLHELPELIKRAAYTTEALPDALALLWQLAQKEGDVLRPYPKAAQDVLIGLAKPAPHQSHERHHLVLDAAEQRATAQAARLADWDGDPAALPHFPAPWAIARTLDRSVDLSWSDGASFVLDHGTPRAHLPYIQAVRRRALTLLERYALAAGPIGALAAVAPLAAHVRTPSTSRAPTDPDIVHAFESESRWALAALGRLVATHRDPHLADLVWRRIRWFAARGEAGLRRRAARRLRCRIQEVPGWTFLRALHRDQDRWVGRDRGDTDEPDDRGTGDSYDLHSAQGDHEQDAAAQAYLNQEVPTQRAAAELTELLDRLRNLETWHLASGNPELPNAWAFFSALGRHDPSYAHALSLAVFETYGETFGYAIAALAEGARKGGAALDHLHALSQGQAPERVAAAQALHSVFWSGRPSADEWAVLARLLADPAAEVVTAAVRVWKGALNNGLGPARALLLTVAPGANQTAGAELFATVGDLLDDLTETETDHLLGVALDLPSIDDPSVLTFLLHVAIQDPQTIFDLLVSRAERESDTFTALPFHIDEPLFAQTPDPLRADLLHQAIQLSLAAVGSDSSYPAHRLVHTLAAGFPAVVVQVVTENLAWDDDHADVALSLVRDLPEPFPIEHPDAVRALLNAAEQGGGHRRRARAEDALRAALGSGMRSRQIGSPCPTNVWQRDQARALADRLRADPRLRAFYLSVSEAAAAAIRRDQADDAEDRRDA